MSQNSAPDRQAKNRVEVARAGDAVIFKVFGLGCVNNAGLMWDFAGTAMAEGWFRFAIDLADCRGLDSTFLGTMVGMALEVEDRSDSSGWLAIFNCSESNKELFEIVGADRYVRFKTIDTMEPIETEVLGSTIMAAEKRLDLVKRAHENLIGIDERNEARFGEFLKCLATELSKES